MRAVTRQLPVLDDDADSGPRRFADIVYQQIYRLIARGEFPEGCKLPPEEDLGVRFGVSRPIVREALARLREQGFVRSQRGSGSIVIRGAEPGIRAWPPIRTVADLLRSYEFRINVEVATAGLAAERRTTADIAVIEELLDKARGVLDAEAWHLLADVNFSFHRSIAGATQNPYYLHALQMMPNFVGRDRLDIAVFGGDGLVERRLQIHHEHCSILAAVRERDVAAARSEMERHIASARDFVLERQTLRIGDWSRDQPSEQRQLRPALD